jgi:hypothetical protein
VAEQPANDSPPARSAIRLESERCYEVGDDRIVIPRVQRDVIAAGVDDCANDVERLISVEWCDLDGNDRRNLDKPPPERVRERTAADRRLQIEPDDRNARTDRLAVRDKRRIVGVRKRREAQQTGMVAEPHQEIGFAERLVGPSTDPANTNQPLGAMRVRAIHLFGRNREYRLEQTNLAIANRELGRVNAHGKAAGARRRVVTRQRSLMALVECAVRVERQRVRGNDTPVLKRCPDIVWNFAHRTYWL